MKITVTKLTIKNVGLIADQTIDFNKPLILLYGQIRQGKTTFLNAVRWVLGADWPDDIIQHGKKEASILLEILTDGVPGSISKSWYRGKDEKTKARATTFINKGREVESPVHEIKRLLNPFLMDQDHFRKMNDGDRTRFLVDLFQVDTAALDAEAIKARQDAEQLRAKIRGYGDIDLTKVEPVDVSPLRQKLAKIRADYSIESNDVDAANRAAETHNMGVARAETRLETIRETVLRLEAELAAANASKASGEKWLAENPRKATKAKPAAPDTVSLEATIQDSAAQNVRAEQSKANIKRAEARMKDEADLKTLEARQRVIKTEKAEKLQGVSKSCGIAGLEFSESGEFTYQGTAAGMLSTSQIMRLSSELSQLYPEGFGLDLIDRGESLGKSIFEFVERAQKEEKTILATIVGEKPAEVPENVGVFVVENGEAK